VTDPAAGATEESRPAEPRATDGTSSSASSFEAETPDAAVVPEVTDAQSAAVPSGSSDPDPIPDSPLGETLRDHVARLDELDERPVAEHVERYAALHDELQAALHHSRDPAG
jgi:hypothetical protein